MSEKIRVSKPFFYDCMIENNIIYFPLANYNAICKASLHSDQADIMGVFPNIPAYEMVSYAGVYKYKEYFLFSPNPKVGKNILLYNSLECKFSELKVENSYFRSDDVFENNEYIYIVSRTNAEIYKVDMQNASIKRIKYKEFSSDTVEIGELVRKGNSIFISLNSGRIMVIFDMDREEFQYIKYPSNLAGISTICFYRGEWWITGADKKVYCWKLGEDESYESAEFPDNISLYYQKEVWFARSFIYNGILWLFPVFADAILKYDILKKLFEKVEILGEEESEKYFENGRFFLSKYGIVKQHNRTVFFLSSKTRILYEMDLETNEIQKHCLKINNIYNGKLFPESVNGVFKEEWYTEGLKDLIREQAGAHKAAVKERTKIGKNINDNINKDGL